jgi:MoaA/NifB/PqqE/SkfB family radical SAM enzyme
MSIMRAVGQAVDVLRLLPIGGPSCCNIAVTNVCNATCDFCNYAKDKDFVTEKKWLDPERLNRALDILHARGIRYITFSGGEPMLHPKLYDMISAVAFRGMRPAMVTNGSALTEQNIRDLATAGLKTLFISIDSPEAEKHEKNRGLPGVFEKIRKANALLRSLGIKTVASCTINRLIGDFEALFASLDDLGFSTVTFTYPKKELNSG